MATTFLFSYKDNETERIWRRRSIEDCKLKNQDLQKMASTIYISISQFYRIIHRQQLNRTSSPYALRPSSHPRGRLS